MHRERKKNHDGERGCLIVPSLEASHWHHATIILVPVFEVELVEGNILVMVKDIEGSFYFGAAGLHVS